MALETAVPKGLEALLMDPAAMRAMEEGLVNRSRGDIERTAGNEAQKVSEDAFGRGMGLSTLNAYKQGQIERARDEALGKNRIDANNAVRSAQQAALGTAAQYLTAGRAQAQQADQFGRGLSAQKSMHTQNMVMSGLAGLAGMAAKGGGYVWGDKLKKVLNGEGSTTSAPGAGPYAGAQAPSGQGTGDIRKADAALEPNLASIAESASPASDAGDSGMYDFSSPSSAGSNFGLQDFSSFNPSQFDMTGWADLADLIDRGDF